MLLLQRTVEALRGPPGGERPHTADLRAEHGRRLRRPGPAGDDGHSASEGEETMWGPQGEVSAALGAHLVDLGPEAGVVLRDLAQMAHGTEVDGGLHAEAPVHAGDGARRG